MGYFIKYREIAKISAEPAKVSLASNPNFVQFENTIPLSAEVYKPVDIEMKVNKPFYGFYMKEKAIVDPITGAVTPPAIPPTEYDDFLQIIIRNGKVGFYNPGFDLYQEYNEKNEYIANPSHPDVFFEYINFSRFAVEEAATGIRYWFKGIGAVEEALGFVRNEDITFRLSDIPAQTAQNMRDAMMKCPFLRDNFVITSQPVTNPLTGDMTMGDKVRLVSRRAGIQYAFKIIPDEGNKGLTPLFVEIIGDPMDTIMSDSINESKEMCDIELEVYKNSGVFLGEDDKPTDGNIGTFVNSLSKAYFNNPIWFDINTLSDQRFSSDFLHTTHWANAGTAADIRFVAKRVTSNKAETFYYSSVHYMLTGYDRNLEANDLQEYVYDVDLKNRIRPLTRQPIVNHVKGQSQYFNFVLSHPHYNKENTLDSQIGIQYELLTQSGAHIATVVKHETDAKDLHIVNTIQLGIDSLLSAHVNVGTVRARLWCDGRAVSEPMSFTILPPTLYSVNDFAFLNSLGGWSSFNFSGSEQMDFKSTAHNAFSTQTPDSRIDGRIEFVHTKDAEEYFTVQTMPIDHRSADWLKEMSVSKAIYELSTKRYVVVDEMNIKHTSQDSLVRVEMKFHYSDSYNSSTK